MRRSLNEYSTLRPGYEMQQQQAYEKWKLQVASLRNSSRWLMVSLKSSIIMRKHVEKQSMPFNSCDAHPETATTV